MAINSSLASTKQTRLWFVAAMIVTTTPFGVDGNLLGFSVAIGASWFIGVILQALERIEAAVLATRATPDDRR